MSYSIFSETMADMTYLEVKKAAQEGALVLFPIAAIEEHGPHICLGTDVYMVYNLCIRLKHRLEENNVKTIVVPPFYWGINHLTSAFTGSFTSQESTMKQMIIQINTCLKNWGFNRVIALSGHNDYLHNKVIIDSAKECTEQCELKVHVPLPDDIIKLYGYNGDEEFLLAIQSSIEVEKEEYIDLHAGSNETSHMLLRYPKLVDEEKLKDIIPTKVTESDFKDLFAGGEESKKLMPNGYCGNPSKIDMEKAKQYEESTIKDIISSILKLVK